MSKSFVRRLVPVVILGVVALAIVLGGLNTVADAAYRVWKVSGLTATINPSAIDTSDAISAIRCEDMFTCIVCECDSALVTVQGTVDGTNWWTVATKQFDGTDGTIAAQWYGPVFTALGTDSKSDIPMPPPDQIRYIVNVNDVVDTDTLGTLSVTHWCAH